MHAAVAGTRAQRVAVTAAMRMLRRVRNHLDVVERVGIRRHGDAGARRRHRVTGAAATHRGTRATFERGREAAAAAAGRGVVGGDRRRVGLRPAFKDHHLYTVNRFAETHSNCQQIVRDNMS